MAAAVVGHSVVKAGAENLLLVLAEVRRRIRLQILRNRVYKIAIPLGIRKAAVHRLRFACSLDLLPIPLLCVRILSVSMACSPAPVEVFLFTVNVLNAVRRYRKLVVARAVKLDRRISSECGVISGKAVLEPLKMSDRLIAVGTRSADRPQSEGNGHQGDEHRHHDEHFY